MIDIILSFQNTYKNNYGMDTSVKSTPVDKHILHKYFYEKQRKEKWNYWTADGMLLYLQVNSCPEMSITMYQNAVFSNNPMILHKGYIKWLGQYIYHTNK